MKICYLKDNIKYIEEFALICHEEWGTPWKKGEEKDKLNKKVEKEKSFLRFVQHQLSWRVPAS